MKATLRGSIATFACALAATSFLASPAAAQTTTLMDILFGNQRRAPLQSDYPAPPAPGAYGQQGNVAIADPEPVVTGPTYKTYNADRLEAVDLAGLFDPITTGSVDAEKGAEMAADEAQNGTASREFRVAVDALEGQAPRALPEVGEALRAFYSEHPDFVWIGDDGVTESARAALSVLEEADKVGLSAADYRVAMPEDDPTPAKMARFEMDMTVATLTYVLDATRGRIDPNRISGYHDFERKAPDLERAMNRLARGGNVARYLQNRSPDNGEFKALATELERLRAEERKEDRVVIAPDVFVRPGGSTVEMANVVAAIESRGSDALKTEYAVTLADYDGGEQYTPELVALVEGFQDEAGLTSDGVIGPNTILAMTGMSNADKIRMVEFSMERMRWLNRKLGERHVMINAAGFTATYNEEGSEDLTMRAVVGTKANQTYFFQDELERVEFNPYWGVPRSIIVNEMLPKLRQDPSYLDRQGYEVSTRSGTQIASSSVNWYTVGADMPFNVRQPPGPSNALGELKIMFPNSHAIYMHDTPAEDLFARDTRAYSHGCVRLEDPRAMAAAVLGETREKVDGHVAQGNNHSVSIDTKIPVYVAYFTAWPNAGGEVAYYRDVYERDMYLERAFKATDDARRAEI